MSATNDTGTSIGDPMVFGKYVLVILILSGQNPERHELDMVSHEACVMAANEFASPRVVTYCGEWDNL